MTLHSADALTDAEVRALMADEAVKVVMVAGPPSAGKTTILASIYQELVQGAVGEWGFAGSLSLRGFATLAYWSETASNAERPFTVRTNYDISRPWLHLCLARDGVRFTVVIADISGEYFGQFAGGGHLGPVETYFKRADHVVHLLDASLLGERRDRLRALAASQGLTRRFAESGIFSARTQHTMVISKIDSCEDASVVDAAAEQVQGWADRWFAGAELIRVAARPKNNAEPIGLTELLNAVFTVQAFQPQQAPKQFLSRVARRLLRRRLTIHPPVQNELAAGGAA